MDYEPEKYWNQVASRIAERNEWKLIAGDDGPFYRYKRKKFLALLKVIPFYNKTVLEIGPGPGGNLLEVYSMQPIELHAVDISQEMISMAKEAVKGKDIYLVKTDDAKFPYPACYFDLSFTATVLQHNTNELMLLEVIQEICRVTRSDVYIFERIEDKIKGTPLCLGRPVTYYQNLFQKHGFNLKETKFLSIQASYLACGLIRKLANKPHRKEGEGESKISILLQKAVLPLTKQLDSIFKSKRELAMLHFSRS